MKTTVLVVDDHAGFRMAARRMLEAGGMEVVAEADGAGSAVTAALAHRPDLVLLDVRLQDGDGFEVARDLRDAGTEAVMIMTSSRTEASYHQLATTAGAAGFIAKSDLAVDRLVELLRSGAPS